MSSIRRINCENCSAPYAINVATLRKEKNTVTCRRCKHKMIISKSVFSEPKTEKARVVHEEEKTLVEEPNVQQQMPNLETVISRSPPPLSLEKPPSLNSDPYSKMNDTQDLEVNFEHTASPSAFPPLHSRRELNKNLDDSTAPRAKMNISPRSSNRGSASVYPEENLDNSAKQTPPSTVAAPKTPAGLSMSLSVVAVMVSMAMFSSFGQYYLIDPVQQKISLIVSAAALMLALFLVVTSSFGKKESSMGLSLVLSALTTVLLGAGLFIVDGATLTSDELASQSEKEVIKKDDAPKNVTDTEEKEGKPVVENKKAERAFTNKIVTSPASNENEVVRNTVSKTEPSRKEVIAKPLPEPEQEPSVDPIERDAPEPDMDLGMDDFDLDLDAEEEKKSRFSRKVEETNTEPKVEANKEATASKNVEIPQSVMDIIIRNNKGVKGCYVSHRSEHGSFPKKVEVLFTLQPSGKVSQAYIAEGPYVGSKFESCLRSAFKGMTFPAFDASSKPQSLRYTLKI